mmetsp:Transcript_32874/g.50292  ORF Transcript_32874/g.50292 Transcript_32874/m.50292 type:complete len:242 (-) Transcript_32874:225-950(-)|eukprot:CAMPEP_0118701490 /NCGR_PEP_ID=MMETSP0800-20121206/17285_1 /TAXON_ID=210618 ORGANISM="Striatella unipunctata, Strain CCMP2910" /NCGR_SAMPLE_ID=MMETSP0800 /ASSEMBLY_ACC=CAM_ASM_000638 /LENGTH=241 /DNA_ID=CAMNT_0006602427 /DNA_START=99 /DNA_END=824 /DNA_ORIENTATION=+
MAMVQEEMELVEAAALELEGMRTRRRSSVPTLTADDSSCSSSSSDGSSVGLSSRADSDVDCACTKQENSAIHQFPSSCLELLRTLPGNSRCVDCNQFNPEWASVSYGVLLCLKCSGRHRGMGVKTSFVRSLTMDSWSQSQVLTMLEGGNDQLSRFFERHSLGVCKQAGRENENGSSGWTSFRINKGEIEPIVSRRYSTKAAQFYRQELGIHVERVMERGEYKGRKASREISKRASASSAPR